MYVENRVRVSEFGVISPDSPLLVAVPTVPGKVVQKVHVLVARKFGEMSAATTRDLGVALLAASGRRDRLWDTFEDYRRALVAQYGPVVSKLLGRPASDAEAFKYGQQYRAFESPHETGLAVDLGCGGLSPVSATIPAQKKTRLYSWLVQHMWAYGFTPYLKEPWHVEMRLSLSAYRTGVPDGPVVASAAPPANCCEDDACCEAEHAVCDA
jgi:hypothetical protein